LSSKRVATGLFGDANAFGRAAIEKMARPMTL
jgi:hypothetical protein